MTANQTAAGVANDYDLFLFDLDGTLITPYLDNSDKNFHSWCVLPHRNLVLEALRKQRKDIAVITNQAGIAFGYCSEKDWESKVEQVQRVFADRINGFFFCYAHKGAPSLDPEYQASELRPAWDLTRRKPSPNMVFEAMGVYGVLPERTVFIGDMSSDEETAKNAGVDYIDAEEFFA